MRRDYQPKCIDSLWELKIQGLGKAMWHMPLIPTLGRQRQVELCEFEGSLVYRASSRTGFKAAEKPCLGKTKQNNPHPTHTWL